jgi:hypothetical protein
MMESPIEMKYEVGGVMWEGGLMRGKNNKK